MSYPTAYSGPHRPGIVDLITIASFVLSTMNVLWVGTLSVLVLVMGGLSWLGGPAVGAIGTTISLVALAVLLSQFLLSILLFMAAWKAWGGQPGGRSLHQIWAWIILILDLPTLFFTGGMEAGAWVRLIYAIVLIVVLNRPDVRAYFQRASLIPPG